MNGTSKLLSQVRSVSRVSLGTKVRGAFARALRLTGRVRWIVAVALVLVAAGSFAYYRLVYAPAHTATTAALQTSVVRQGTLTISASGSGSLVAKEQVDLSFHSSGTVTALNVAIGDQVKKGDLLATIEDSDLQLAYTQARRSLEDLTSASAMAEAEAAVATAQNDLTEANQHLEYVISPAVYYWENQVRTRQAALDDARAAAAASPSDQDAQSALTKAEASLKSAKASLGSAQWDYENNYVKNNFVYYVTDPLTRRKIRYEAAPSEADILDARASVAEAVASLKEAQDLLVALQGGEIPEDATGSSLTALEQARQDVKDAQDALEGASLKATIAGTVMAVNISVGETAKSGTTAITISDLSQPYLEVFLDESDWSNIKTGAQADITFDIIPDETFQGKVMQVDPGLYTQGNSSVVRAYVQLSQEDAAKLDLPLGTAASVDVIASQAQDAILVPVEALHKLDSGDYAVFVMENGTPTLRTVKIGIQDLVNAQVLSGLQAGEVVTTGVTETK